MNLDDFKRLEECSFSLIYPRLKKLFSAALLLHQRGFVLHTSSNPWEFHREFYKIQRAFSDNLRIINFFIVLSFSDFLPHF